MGKDKAERKRKRADVGAVSDGAGAVASTSTAAVPSPVATSLASLFAPTSAARDTELDALFKATPVVEPRPAALSAPKPARPMPRTSAAPNGILGPEAFLGKRKADKAVASPPNKRVKKSEPATAPSAESVIESASEDEDEGEDAAAPIVHESMLPGYVESKAAKQTKRARAAADDEDPVVRNARTVFVGNVPTACALNKSSRKAFNRYIMALLNSEGETATGKIESMRFRGLAPAESVKTRTRPDKPTEPAALPHGAARAATYRKRGDLLGTDELPPVTPATSGIVFQTEAQKRKLAAIKGKIHEGVASCVAYVVLDSSAAVDTLIAVPATTLAATPFEGNVLRFDRVTEGKGPSVEAPREESRRTAFLGGLDFAQSEQGVRDWAEAQIQRERGSPEDGSTWVQSVRLVRDRQTGMGKGFAYVLLADNDCVDELVALAPEHLKLSKRKIRVQRCASAAKLEAQKAIAAKTAARKTSAAANALAQPPRSDRKSRKSSSSSANKRPARATLDQRHKAETLATLAKPERKAAKSADADRIARRLEKKKEKLATERRIRKEQARRVKV